MMRPLNLYQKIVFAMLVAMWLLVGYWLWYPYDTVRIDSIEILNTDKTVESGGVLVYRIKGEKFTDKPGHLMRHYVNGVRIEIDSRPQPTTFKKGPIDVVIFVRIPDIIPAGKGRMSWKQEYQLNPIRVDGPKDESYSDYFTVTKPPVRGERGPEGKRGKQGDQGDKGIQGKRGEPGKDFGGK